MRKPHYFLRLFLSASSESRLEKASRPGIDMAWSHILSRRLNLGSALRGSPRLGHYVFAFVFLVRLIALARLTSSPFLLPSGGDMHFYDDWARQILHGRFTDHFAFYGLPLYAYLLAFLYKVFGYSPFVPGFLQACLDAGTAALLYKIAVRVFQNGGKPIRNHAIGILAAAGWAFFVPAQAYSVILMPTTWFVFVFWFLVWQIAKAERAPNPLRCLAYGTLIGITTTGVATILFLVPLVLAALLLKPWSDTASGSPWIARGAAVALLFLGLGAGTAPCWVHNYFVARDPVFLSAHSGINLWLGNNPEATGYPHFPGLHAGQAAMLKDSIDLAEAAAGRNLKRSEVSDYWSAKARAYITTNFGAWLKLMCRKLGNFWNALEYDDLSVIANLRQQRVLLPGPHFGIIAALAIPGLFFSLRVFLASRWIAAAIFLHMAAVLPVFVTERYRLAAVPGLLVFAAFGLQALWQSCLLGSYRTLATYLGLLLAAAIFVTLPRTEPSLWAMEAYNSGRQALESNNLPLAELHLQRAYAYVPDNPETNFALGNLRLAQSDPAGAKSFYRAALQADAKHKGALNNLGVIALDERQWKMAINFFHASIQSDPADATTHYLLARAELENGNAATALSEIQIALHLQPEQPEFRALFDTIRARQ
jgi:tetratricopeptide (TPR) repeat protein